jgi:hypothetical protein
VSPTRREFIKRVGIALGSLMVARCALPAGKSASTPEDDVEPTYIKMTCYIEAILPTETPSSTEQLDQQGAILTAVAQGDDVAPEVARLALIAFHRERLRSCWLQLDWLAEQASDWNDYEKGDRALEQLRTEHRAALDELVVAGELEADVADCAQVAFDEAAFHVWRANCGMTCYEPLVCPDYTAAGSDQLVQQAELLADLADDDSVDQDTVARTRATIERDIAFLNLSSQDEQALYNELMDPSGTDCLHLPFDQLELEITPEVAEAARFLVELLLEE